MRRVLALNNLPARMSSTATSERAVKQCTFPPLLGYSTMGGAGAWMSVSATCRARRGVPGGVPGSPGSSTQSKLRTFSWPYSTLDITASTARGTTLHLNLNASS
jgi:hypothetical protein